MRSGLSYQECWDLTPAEIIFNIKQKNRVLKDDVKESLQMNYQLATMVANFVGLSMNGKKIPSFNELYPGLSDSDAEQDFKDAHDGLTRAEYNRAMMAKEQMLDFAMRHNKNK